MHDAVDLPIGDVKIKLVGGNGRHNGLKDTINAINSNEFYRLSIGIAHPGSNDDVVDYVLNAPGKSELSSIEQGMSNAMSIIDLLVNGNFEDAMKALHT